MLPVNSRAQARCAVPLLPAKTSRRAKGHFAATKVALILVFFVEVFPEMLVAPFRPFGVSAESGMITCCLVLLVVEFIHFRWRLGAPVWIAITVGIFMMFVGLDHSGDHLFDKRQFYVDGLTYSALVLGLAWSAQSTRGELIGLLIRIGYLSAGSLIVTLVLLRLGIIETPLRDRMYTASVYHATWIICCIAPVLTATLDARDVGTLRWSLGATVVSLGAVLAAATLSATRSLVIEASAASIACLAVVPPDKRTKRLRRFLFSALVLLGLCAYIYSLVSSRALLLERLRTSEPSADLRFVEVEVMLDQLDGRLSTGSGFGSFYAVPLAINKLRIAAAPHIGVLTFLLKGGVVGFTICIAVPAVVCFYGLVKSRRDRILFAFWSGAALYLLFGSISGGWVFGEIFLYSLCWSAGHLGIQRLECNRPARRGSVIVPTAQW